MTIELSQQQTEALEQVQRWHARAKDGGPQVFRLFGYAGTGKTTIAKRVQEFAGKVQYGAFTGKAALVLRGKGCDNAKTIHSMIYKSHDKSVIERDALKAQLAEIKDDLSKRDEAHRLAREIEQMNRKLQQPGFTLNPNAFIRKWDVDVEQFVSMVPPSLIAIDECSMVDKYLGQDLLSFGIPILVLGDPAQLPPVAGGGFFTGSKDSPVTPDVMLTEIHRQAADNPVLRIATACRQYGMPQPGEYGDSCIIPWMKIPKEEWLQADQILCGINDTRKMLNQRTRVNRGFEGILPCVGERLVCLRNNHRKGLLNGSMWEVLTVTDETTTDYFKLTLRSLDDRELEDVETVAHKKPFLGQDFEDFRERNLADEFDFGYCITTHKAQGSEWEHVIYVDEWRMDDRKRHQYTGVTRARSRVTVAQR